MGIRNADKTKVSKTIKNEYEKSTIIPFFSLLMILMSLFSVAFLKMEVRRKGYMVLKEIRDYRELKNMNKKLSLDYASFVNPDRLKKMAQSRLALSEAQVGQVIHMSGHEIALKR